MISRHWRQGDVTRTADFVVAANDAPMRWKMRADYVCDGTDDHVQIQAAIDAVGTLGGSVELSPGTFTIGAQIAMYGYPLTLRGQGMRATILSAKNSLNTDMIMVGTTTTPAGTVVGSIRDMTLTGNSANNTSGSGIRVQSGDSFIAEHLVVTDFEQHGIYIEGVSGSYRADYASVINCRVVLNLGHGIFVESPANAVTIASCYVSDNGVNASTFDNIYFSNIADWAISDCFIWQGKRNNVGISQGGPGTMVGNTFNTPQESDIWISSAAGITVTGSVFQDASARTASTYPHILLASSGRVVMVGNRFENSVTNPPSDILTETGTSDENIFASNSLNGTIYTITKIGAATLIRNNVGYTTENSGTGSIASGATTAVVTHGLSVTPTLDDISIVFGEQGTNDYGRWWISNITATQFTLNVSADPGASNLDFAWRATVL